MLRDGGSLSPLGGVAANPNIQERQAGLEEMLLNEVNRKTAMLLAERELQESLRWRVQLLRAQHAVVDLREKRRIDRKRRRALITLLLLLPRHSAAARQVYTLSSSCASATSSSHGAAGNKDQRQGSSASHLHPSKYATPGSHRSRDRIRSRSRSRSRDAGKEEATHEKKEHAGVTKTAQTPPPPSPVQRKLARRASREVDLNGVRPPPLNDVG